MSRFVFFAAPAVVAAMLASVLIGDLPAARSAAGPGAQADNQRWEYRVVTDNLFMGGGRGDLLSAAEYQRTAEYRNANPVLNPKIFNDYSTLLDQGLNTLGRDGWELCYVNQQENRYVFRRPSR